jgi:universal stress protein A
VAGLAVLTMTSCHTTGQCVPMLKVAIIFLHTPDTWTHCLPKPSSLSSSGTIIDIYYVSDIRLRDEQMGYTSQRKDITMASQRFLVPIDFSESANQALEYAINLAGKLDAHLTLLHVIQSVPLGGVDMGVALPYTYLQDLEVEITQSMEACLARVTAASLEGDIVVVHGVPFHEVVETAKTQKVDLIVMGTHGRSGLQHVLLGSVAEKVVRLAPCPVLVARQPTSVPVS